LIFWNSLEVYGQTPKDTPVSAAVGAAGGAGGGGGLPPHYPVTAGIGPVSPAEFLSPNYQNLMHYKSGDPGGSPPGGPGGGGGGGGGDNGGAASPEAAAGSGAEQFKDLNTMRFGEMYSLDQRKKVESFTLSPLPEARLFKVWKDKLYSKITAKSGFPEMSLKWIYEVEDELRTWEDYYEARPFMVIDAALRDALCLIIPDTHRVGRKVRAIRHDYEKRKDAAGKPDPRYLKGRQILKIIFDHYKIGDINHRIKEMEDIMSLKMINNDLFRFHDEWLFCLMVQKLEPTWEFKLTRYYGQVKKHPELEHDMATYHRFQQDGVRFGPGFTDH